MKGRMCCEVHAPLCKWEDHGVEGFKERVKELAAGLMRYALDEMQEHAKAGLLLVVDDGGNVISVPPMQEETDRDDTSKDAQDKLTAQMRRVDVWAQQVARNAL